MKMNYPLRPKQRKSPFVKTAWGVVFALGVIVYILLVLESTALFGVFSPIVSPLWRAKQYTHTFILSHIGFLQSKQALVSENLNLRKKLDDLTIIDLERETFQQENEALKKIYNSGGSDGDIARLLTSPAQSLFDIVTAEVGPQSSVRPGDLVYGYGSVILGSVVDRKGNFIHIKYFSSSGVETPAQIGTDATSVVLVGQGSGNFLFVAPRDFVVSVGDTVIFPNMKTSILGRVEAVESLRADSLKNVYISYPINIFELSFVSVHSNAE